jgi:hypothetical protein
MKILILATMAPLCGFYLYVLVNFQREIRRAKREKFPGARTIPLSWRGGQLSSADPATCSVGASPESQMARERETTGASPDDRCYATSPVSLGSSQEIYQFDSVYLGPFLLVPIQNRKENDAQGCVTKITARRAG